MIIPANRLKEIVIAGFCSEIIKDELLLQDTAYIMYKVDCIIVNTPNAPIKKIHIEEFNLVYANLHNATIINLLFKWYSKDQATTPGLELH